MSKNEFLKELRDYLTGQVSAPEVEDSIRYYDKYISDQVSGGMSERAVVESLGDPRIIGRSIVDAAARKKTEGSAASRGYENTSFLPRKGYSGQAEALWDDCHYPSGSYCDPGGDYPYCGIFPAADHCGIFSNLYY